MAARPDARYQSILCPVDFSTHSQHALQYAARLAQQCEGRVTALFVNEPLLVIAAKKAYGSQGAFVERSRLELSQFVERAIGAKAIPVTTIVTVGDAPEEILRAARRLRSDLLVVGTQGLSGVGRLFFGSTTAELLQRAQLPVFAVPPVASRRRPAGGRQLFDRLVVPIDLTGDWLSDAVRAAAVARTFNVPLHLMHVLRPPLGPAWMRPASAAATSKRIARAKRRLERVTRLLDEDVRSTCSVAIGEPAHEIARLTRRGLPLVVMSLRGTRAILGRRGAIAYHVLTHAQAPVLALPRRQLGGPLLARIRREIADTLSARDRAEMAAIDALLSHGATDKPAKR